ncbi:INO80 complex subunit D-like isoform X2 [Phoenix dactylifera]|uniref:KAT8 regulatory NSL complex subunit 2 n=1 Tax=Phoenix dactylifera TaxID=42345 RepID=A0A8B8J9X1_PHODC|nr:INO80 complex subunit D-like isoform X2 [Phoenix dactylifera]XP_038989665.1 INO80 complex subunit D-like isoform X2 [Phoenix dactylifera]XP_038989666.1 INO80 complex subunit D-like isoform X2 [Phoenix dactylifera]
MGASNKLQTAFKPPKRELPLPHPPDFNTNHAGSSTAAVEGGVTAVAVEGAEEDEVLRDAGALSREEVLRRRARRVRQLENLYRRKYWALVEEVRVRHRDYYWEFGVSPVVEEGRGNGPENGGVGVGEGGGLGFREPGGNSNVAVKGERKRCAFSGCKTRAMPLTKYCHAHILLDGKQTLYKPCNYVTRSGPQNGQVFCGKPVLRAAMPSLCHVHFQKTQRNILQALKRSGLHTSCSSRPAPKFNVLIAECVRQIQARRRETLNAATNNIAQEENEKT